jgi:hypothetical protein
MRRRTLAPKDSLDLLLDTMCNAFGGIVLMAILIALLIQDGGPGKTPSAPARREAAEAARKARELAALEAEIASLEEKREANRELIDLVRRRNELEAAAAERRASGNLSNAQLNKRLGDLLGEKSAALDQLGRASASLATAKAELLEKQGDLARIEGGLEDFVASRVSPRRGRPSCAIRAVPSSISSSDTGRSFSCRKSCPAPEASSTVSRGTTTRSRGRALRPFRSGVGEPCSNATLASCGRCSR